MKEAAIFAVSDHMARSRKLLDLDLYGFASERLHADILRSNYRADGTNQIKHTSLLEECRCETGILTTSRDVSVAS